MLRTATSALAILTLCSFAGGADRPPPSRASGDLAIQAREILRQHCSECHTGKPDVGQSKLNVLEYAQLTAERPVSAVKPGGRSQILELIKDGSMPPGNRPGPTPKQIAVLEEWVAASAPAYPATFNDRHVLDSIADDLTGVAPKEKFVRYSSFAHLIRDGEPLPDLVAEERKLREGFAFVSLGSAALLVKPVHSVPTLVTFAGHFALWPQARITPVNSTATLYRIELPEHGWGKRELFRKMDRLKEGEVFALRPFDVIQMEYPFATRLPAGDPLTKRFETVLGTKEKLPLIPYVQGNWLSSAIASEGKLTPLGEDVKSLVALDLALVNAIDVPDGPPVPRLLGTRPFSFPRATPELTPNPPLAAVYTGSVSSEPPPFKFDAEFVSDGKPVTEVKIDEPFKLRVRSSKRVFVTVLTVQADGDTREPELRDGPINLPAEKTVDLQPEDNPFVITSIPTKENSATEYHVVFASEVDFRVTIVRSQHDDRRLWRFVLVGAGDGFDPNKVVRRVLPITVTRKK